LDQEFDRVQRREHPLNHVSPRVSLGGQKDAAPLRDPQHDRARLEEAETVLLEDRHLSERLHGAERLRRDRVAHEHLPIR